MRVLGYTRVSSKGQVDGDGPTRQSEAIRKFCGDHNLKLVTLFHEEVSGTAELREEFSRMVEFAEDVKDIDAVVVERMDRLARDLMVSEFLLKELRTRKIKLFAVDQGALIDLASDDVDPTRKLIRQILAALAEWDKSQLVLKLRLARERKTRLTGWQPGSRPFGDTPAELRTLNIIKNFLSRDMTQVRIAQLLNEAGLTTRYGKKWSQQKLSEMLKNQL
jgi:DNA invertase Pin-like site-specific DNA recombinase